MALISCPECGKEISDKAVACPHCGNPMNPQVQQTQQEEYLCCPKCGSRELHEEHTLDMSIFAIQYGNNISLL